MQYNKLINDNEDKLIAYVENQRTFLWSFIEK